MPRLIARPASTSCINDDQPGRDIDPQTAYAQIGARVLMELGAKNRMYSRDYIQFDTTGKRRRVIVKLTVWDTYTVEIGRVVKRDYLPTYEVLHQVDHVYCDRLAEIVLASVRDY